MSTDSDTTHGVRPDLEIARDMAARLEAELRFSYSNIKSAVKNGRVTLEGKLEWHYQVVRAETTALCVKGVVGISNRIELAPHVNPSEVMARIENAMKSGPQLEVE